MGLAQWINDLLRGKTKEDSSQNWILSPYTFEGLGWKIGEDGWVYPAENIYNSDAINNPIDRIAKEVSKVKIKSIVEKEGKVTIQDDDISRLFRFHPNPLQTTADFMNCLVWMVMKYNNAFVYPQFTWVTDSLGQRHKRFEAFWILKPIEFEVGTDASGNVWEIKFILSDGGEYILPYSDVIHLKWRRGTNLFKGGGDDFGYPQVQDVANSVNAMNATLEGLPKAIASSLQVKGVYNAKTVMDSARMAEQQKQWEQHIMDSKMGMVVTDLAGEFTPVNMTQPVIGEGLVKFMKTGIIQRYGVSEEVLNGDFTADQYDAFFKSCVEPFMADFEQEMSEKCFTKREKEIGHKIRGYFNTLRLMSVAQKQEMAKIAFNTALMDINGILDMFGLDPIEGGERRLQSLNYVNAQTVDQYQADRAGSTMNETEPTDTTAMSTGEGGNNEN
jgi:HK97 family phage portal protein